jgi:hypothetical protein
VVAVSAERESRRKKIRAAGFELYMIERPATSVDTEVYLIAIDWNNNRGFFYTK